MKDRYFVVTDFLQSLLVIALTQMQDSIDDLRGGCGILFPDLFQDFPL